AEDGIRDSSVTGVQTCALPIYAGDQEMIGPIGQHLAAGKAVQRQHTLQAHGSASVRDLEAARLASGIEERAGDVEELGDIEQEQIGRASCREREQIAVEESE